MSNQKKSVIICGGGIIGCSVGYYLTTKFSFHCTIIEKVSIGSGASGKAGGFLAQSWCDTGPVGPLARLSFKLHSEQSQTFGKDEIDYRPMNTYSLTLKPEKKNLKNEQKEDLNWVDQSGVSSIQEIGKTTNTAQVHPFKLTNTLANQIVKNYGQILYGEVIGIEHEEFNGIKQKITGVKYIKNDDKSVCIVPCDYVVFSMGPWSNKCFSWISSLSPTIPQCLISSYKADSVRFQPRTTVPNTALFMSYFPPSKISPSLPSILPSNLIKNSFKFPSFLDVEVYPRPDGEVYICTSSKKDIPLPETSLEVTADNESIIFLSTFARHLSSLFHQTDPNDPKVEVIGAQACYLPISTDGVPIIGEIPGLEGGYIATGHSCWGILNSSGTGLALSELIATGSSTSLNLKPYSITRFIK